MPTEITTQVASPFKLEDLRAKADAIAAAAIRVTSTAYVVVMLEPIDKNTDTKAHHQIFDVTTAAGAVADPASGIFLDDASARAAALARFSELNGSLAPYCYAAVYSPHDDPARMLDVFVPPATQPILTTVRENKGAIAAVAAGLVGLGAAILSLRRKRPRNRI